jgi:addiction module HigA family antidote
MKARDLSANALALKLRVPANRISDIVRNKRAITAETALRLGRAFGNSPEFWLNLQASYDLGIAQRELGEVIQNEVDVLQEA